MKAIIMKICYGSYSIKTAMISIIKNIKNDDHKKNKTSNNVKQWETLTIGYVQHDHNSGEKR